MTDTQKDEVKKEHEEKMKFLKAFAFVPDHEMASWEWKERDGGKDSPSPLKAWDWIQAYVIAKIEEAESENRKKIIKIVADYIYRNWYSSIGYLNDMQIYENAFYELDWIIKPLAITMEEIVEAVNANKSNLADK